ncbi:hypothetical protein [Chryseosolibacter indicus]|uniref:hypothetical protein n=1 Tax=Chryseosolibacter indicus TaxID=2782351 RepID=UPI0020B412FB|nr:hypothetical protein [Chryseosolibacter indicus]
MRRLATSLSGSLQISIITTKTKSTTWKSESSSKSIKTTGHGEIQKWVEERGGKPATVKGTGDEVGVLRIDFPGYSGGGTLQQITWEQFFESLKRVIWIFYTSKKHVTAMRPIL